MSSQEKERVGPPGQIPARILVLEKNSGTSEAIRSVLKESDWLVQSVFNPREAERQIQSMDFPFVFLNLHLADEALWSRFASLKAVGVAAVSESSNISSVVEALRCGAGDILFQPLAGNLVRECLTRLVDKVRVGRARHEMLSMITHDIKIPLSSILGYSSLLVRSDGTIDPKAPEFAKTINANAFKILTMIDNFLTTSRLEAGQLQVFFRTVNLKYLVEDLLATFAVEVERQRLKLVTNLDEHLPAIEGDENLLFRALGNVLANATKFSPAEGTVALTTAVIPAPASPLMQDAVVISVSNSGQGIPIDEQHEIFEKYRRSRAHRDVEGTGLGTFVLKEIVEAHRGQVVLHSVPNELTTFSIYLPLNRI